MCRMVTVINNNVLYVGWHHWLDGHKFEQSLGVGDGQRSLVCCSLCGPKDLDMTKRLNWTDYMLECYQESRSYILSPHISTHIYKPIIVFGMNALSKFIVILIFQYILVSNHHKTYMSYVNSLSIKLGNKNKKTSHIYLKCPGKFLISYYNVFLIFPSMMGNGPY